MMKHNTVGQGLMLAACAVLASALQAADDGVLTLGEVRVSAPAEQPLEEGVGRIEAEMLRQHDRETLERALELTPGVSSANVGGRGERVVFVRGFDRVQVPIYMDGIPVYVPYDGYVDLGRFTTFDLGRIEVAKGFSSLMYGPNALGGAINLVSRRPQTDFEGEVGGGVGLDREGHMADRRMYANLGALRDKAWIQFGASWLDVGHFTLPAGYRAANVQEEGGRRENSARRDARYSLRVGLTPTEGDEYVFGHVRQDGEKGQPVYAGAFPLTNATRRWWEWPEWDKTSTYLSTLTRFGEHRVLTRAYYDTYRNTLEDYVYENGVPTRQLKTGYPSRYDDYSYGVMVQADLAAGTDNRLQAGYQYKVDVHRSRDEGAPQARYEDRTHYLAVEDTHALTADVNLVAGLSWSRREAVEATNVVGDARRHEPRGEDSAIGGQLGLFWSLGEGQARLTYAHKARFANIKDRYSYRFGRAIPNPDLDTEHADHFEAGYAGVLTPGWYVEGALFRSNIRDSIQSVAIAPTACTAPSPNCEQMQNVGRARVQGLELGVHGEVGAWGVMVNYTRLHRRNVSDPAIRPTDTPRDKLFAALSRDLGAWRVSADVDMASSRYSASDGSRRVGGFAVYGLKAGYGFANDARIEVGVRNLFDRQYAYTEGYPEAGRSYFMQFNRPL